MPDLPDARSVLNGLIENGQLDVVFQPILGLSTRNYLGYEALIRPRANPMFDNPSDMFEVAGRYGLSNALDRACRTRILEQFASQRVPGTLFLNATPSSLYDPTFQNGETLALIRKLGISPSRVVIEITENQHISDFDRFRDVLTHFRGLGYRIAIDDLGQGMSNLRMWTEIHPDFVKIDRHFIHGISSDALKFQLVRAMHGMAETCGACIIAEGIETADDFRTVRDIGIPFAQGFFIARPAPEPSRQLADVVCNALTASRIAVFPGFTTSPNANVTARALLRQVLPVSPHLHNDAVFARLEAEPTLQAIPVIDKDGFPLGIIMRNAMIDRFARPYRRELYGRKPCADLMDTSPMIVDESMLIQDLSRLVTSVSYSAIPDHFIVTEAGRYLGIGCINDMVALITDMQIRAARYANPLTQLPGNVPINEHIERLLANQGCFVAGYADLDAFKPFNDVYGYRRGDDLIQLVAQLLVEVSDPRRDFVGHIGGDDFLVLFQSEDWQARCNTVLAQFGERARNYFAVEDLERGGIITEDRLGHSVFHSLPTLSIGALRVEPGLFGSHHEISTAAAEAKRQAKRIHGNSLFIERRQVLREEFKSAKVTPLEVFPQFDSRL
ncbi:MAG: hypothetical protein H6R19_1819 [Proteobacteria bacterium]|nr:hypothetical protein [Pseudomonadota bacterium]